MFQVIRLLVAELNLKLNACEDDGCLRETWVVRIHHVMHSWMDVSKREAEDKREKEMKR